MDPMPGQDIRLQIQTDLLTCPLCRRPYVKPRTLPCHHTYCETCVARCAGSYLTFPCPSCRQDVAVPVSGVSGFPEDVFLSRLSFKVRTIEEPYVTPYVINECLTHQRAPIRFYCQTCEKPLCRECPRGNHNAHKVSHIEEQIERMKERVGTALSDQRQRSATAVTNLQAVRNSITEILPQKNAMERHIEALVHERIQAIQVEGDALQEELDTMYHKHFSDMTEKRKELESMVETLLTFDVEAERELARGGLVDVNRHGEISEKLKIMYETMNRPVKHSSGFQATFIPTTTAEERLVGYFERGEKPVHRTNNPEVITQSSRVVSHMQEHTFHFGSVSHNGHETGSSPKYDWERENEKGIRAGIFQGNRNRPASARYSDEKQKNGSWVPNRSFSLHETPNENTKSVPHIRRQVSEPANATLQSYTTRESTQQPEAAVKSAQQPETAARSAQQSWTTTRHSQQSDTAIMTGTATRPTQQSETPASNQTSMTRQMSESARPTQQLNTTRELVQAPDTATRPTQHSNTTPVPTISSKTAQKPSRQSEIPRIPTLEPDTGKGSTQQSETGPMSPPQSDTTGGPIQQSETPQKTAQQSETAIRSTQQSDTAHGQQSDTAPSTAQRSETAKEPSLTPAASRLGSNQNFVRWKTIRIADKGKVSKVLEFPAQENLSEEIFL
ncbi:RING finger protein nhl-1-like [Branchiostoma floridae]|uniref:RING finger protein nhl-1-like n=1 Tax=Branchiostoma floridae TaxID=7739 RepID=A0A9J7K5Z3_BRAFL|nr:RING finger protein nhl-1-like [Branchiostoma floridae]